MAFKSVEDKRAYERAWNKRHPGRDVAKSRKRRQRYYRALRELKAAAGCSKCPENHPACLQFHHVSSDKDDNVSDLNRRGAGWKRLMDEIAKCVVLCANCHAKVHDRV